ncbi:MAG: hypothetical protein AB1679_01215 [Actinomycetota bacterium]
MQRPLVLPFEGEEALGRSGVDRRSGGERRRGIRPSKSGFAEIVTPWQIPEPRQDGHGSNELVVPQVSSTAARVVNLLGW